MIEITIPQVIAIDMTTLAFYALMGAGVWAVLKGRL